MKRSVRWLSLIFIGVAIAVFWRDLEASTAYPMHQSVTPTQEPIAVGGAVSTSAQGASATTLEWNSNGNKFAVGYDDGTIQIYDDSGLMLKTLSTHQASILTLQWHPIDEDILISSGFTEAPIKSELLLWDVSKQSSQEMIADLQQNSGIISPIIAVTWNSDFSRIFAYAYEIASVRSMVFDASTYQILQIPPLSRGTLDVVWNSDRTYAIAQGSTGIFMRDAQTLQHLANTEHFIRIGDLSASSTDNEVIVGGILGEVQIWSFSNEHLQLSRELRTATETSLYDNPDGSVIAATFNVDGTEVRTLSRVGDLVAFDPVTAVITHSEQIDNSGPAAFSPDGSRLAYLDSNGAINIDAMAFAPVASGAVTSEGTQTNLGLAIERNAANGSEVTHFKITGITNGTLYQNDGTTPISDGQFITVAQGAAGLKFTPNSDFNGTATFDVQASLSDTDAGLGGQAVTVEVTVNPAR